LENIDPCFHQDGDKLLELCHTAAAIDQHVEPRLLQQRTGWKTGRDHAAPPFITEIFRLWPVIRTQGIFASQICQIGRAMARMLALPLLHVPPIY
jgi:hypothetical protein